MTRLLESVIWLRSDTIWLLLHQILLVLPYIKLLLGKELMKNQHNIRFLLGAVAFAIVIEAVSSGQLDIEATCTEIAIGFVIAPVFNKYFTS